MGILARAFGLVDKCKICRVNDASYLYKGLDLCKLCFAMWYKNDILRDKWRKEEEGMARRRR